MWYCLVKTFEGLIYNSMKTVQPSPTVMDLLTSLSHWNDNFWLKILTRHPQIESIRQHPGKHNLSLQWGIQKLKP